MDHGNRPVHNFLGKNLSLCNNFMVKMMGKFILLDLQHASLQETRRKHRNEEFILPKCFPDTHTGRRFTMPTHHRHRVACKRKSY